MTLTLEDAARVLRAWTGPKILGALIDEIGGRCAIGVLGGEELGYSPAYTSRNGVRIEADAIFQGSLQVCTDDVIGECYGMDVELVDQIEEWNDEAGLTFAEIADKLDHYDE